MPGRQLGRKVQEGKIQWAKRGELICALSKVEGWIETGEEDKSWLFKKGLKKNKGQGYIRKGGESCECGWC